MCVTCIILSRASLKARLEENKEQGRLHAQSASHPPDSSGKVYGTGSGYMCAQSGVARLDSQHLGDGGRRNESLRSCLATGFQG